MGTPAGITRVPVTFGVSEVLESGDALKLSVSIKADTDGMVWAATGEDVTSFASVFAADVGAIVSIPLIPTDLEGWLRNGQAVDVSDGKQSHTYTATITKKTDANKQVGQTVIRGIVVPNGSDPIDADKLIPYTGPTGVTVQQDVYTKTEVDALIDALVGGA